MDEAYKLKNTSWSLFGTVDFEITDRLTFTAGANYTQDRKRFSTDVVGTDIFSAVDLAAAAYTLFRRDLLLGAGVEPLPAPSLAAHPTIVLPDGRRANPLASLNTSHFLPPFLNAPSAVQP